MPLTVGTAGHIDHGKSWLVRALTGKDTDRLPEERERGISIDLGYAPLELPDGRRMSLVDVPGHERFVRTMIAGASGIDLFLLVIDAHEGARPQTHEHLAVLRLLGIDQGVVAVTKADAVDEETLELARLEARELVPDAEVVAVSAQTGAGLDELRAALARVRVEERDRGRATRLYVDRVFTIQGIGTIVTGTLWSGAIAAGDVLRVEPIGAAARVRSVQVHDAPVDRADAGQRVALNLPALERAALARGDVLVEPRYYPLGYRLDVRLTELEPTPPAVTVHVGTKAVAARVAQDGEYAQLRLAEPVVAARGDHVVLRTATTVGGGLVLDPAPPRRLDAERLPPAPWAPAVLNLLGVERRGGTLYLPGAAGRLGNRAQAACELQAELAAGDAVKVADAELGRFLEQQGRLVRVGDGFAIAPELYERGRAALAALDPITLPGFRDAMGISRRTAQLLLERFDADGLTRRGGDRRVLRAPARGTRD